jgi:uncharacterized protein (DUF433 family)
MSAIPEVEKLYAELGAIRQELASVKTQLAQVLETGRQSGLTEHPYVVRSPQMHHGEPTLRGSSILVRTVVERMRIGDTPEQIVEAYPSLGLAQVHDALGYYYDHPGEIEGNIQENREAQWRMMHRASS